MISIKGGNMSKVNIHKIKKPNIEAPVLLPDMQDDCSETIGQLADKYGRELLNAIEKGEETILMLVRQSIVDILLLNYQTISFFMKNAYTLTQDEIESAASMSATSATMGAWCVGKEFMIKKPHLATKFLYKDAIDINDIPYEELQLLEKAAYLPFNIFAVVFSDYYNSTEGKRMRFQKEGHFKDTYQSIMKGVLACFLEGVQS
jgi:hypothetical protein